MIIYDYDYLFMIMIYDDLIYYKPHDNPTYLDTQDWRTDLLKSLVLLL